MKIQKVLAASIMGLIMGIFVATSAVAASIDVINNSIETISVSMQGGAKTIIASGGSYMFAAVMGKKYCVEREPNPVTKKPVIRLREFTVTEDKSYQVVVTGYNVTITLFSGNAY